MIKYSVTWSFFHVTNMYGKKIIFSLLPAGIIIHIVIVDATTRVNIERIATDAEVQRAKFEFFGKISRRNL